MSARAARWGCVGFAAISGTIAFNVLVLQARVEPNSFKARIRAAIQDSERNRAGDAVPIEGARSGATSIGSRPPNRLEPTSSSAPPLPVHEGPPSRELVQSVQRRLSFAGYEPGGLDGTLGDITRGAIFAYEHDYDLALTATPTRALLAHLEGAHPAAGTSRHEGMNPTPEATRLIRHVQTALAALGYSVGPIDGQPSVGLEAAIRAFEMQQALVPSGRISGELVQRLTLAAATPSARRRGFVDAPRW